MSGLGFFDHWAQSDAERHLKAKKANQVLKANLPGPGMFRLIAISIGLLIVNEVMFFQTGFALEPNGAVIVLFAVLGLFFWRYFLELWRLRERA